MRSIHLLKIADEAELLRLRADDGAAGATRDLRRRRRCVRNNVLALAEVAAWQALRLEVQPIYATLILLGINLAIAIVFGVLAARSAPNRAEREALEVRRRALETARGSLAFTAALPAFRLLRGSRRTGRGSRMSFLRR